MNTWPLLIALLDLEWKWPVVLKLHRNELRLSDSVASWTRVDIYRQEVKVKVTIERGATKAERGSRDIAILFL